MILVTGGCGYIGSHICKTLSAAGEDVLVVDNLSSGKRRNLLNDEKCEVGDICDLNFLERIFSTHNIECVIHLAALVNAAESGAKASEYRAVNEQGSENIWSVAHKAGVRRYIYASSAAVYGTPQNTEPLSENAPIRPTNPYGETKLAGENSLKKYGNTSAYCIFRFFNVAGADTSGEIGQSQASRAFMQRVFHAASSGEPLIISGNDYPTVDGTVARDFVHVSDVAHAVNLALQRLRHEPLFQMTLNLGSGEAHTLKEVLDVCVNVLHLPVRYAYSTRVPGDISYSRADITAAQSILNWSPIYSIQDMVRDGWRAYAHI